MNWHGWFGPTRPGPGHIYLDDEPGDYRRGVRGKRVAKVAATTLTLLALLAPSATSTYAAPASQRKLHPQLTHLAAQPGKTVDVLVTLTPDASWSAIAKQVGAKYIKHWAMARTVELSLPESILPMLASLPGVRWVTPNARIAAAGLGGNLATVSPEEIGAPALWDRSITGAGVTVAVLDSGYTPHPDFQNITATKVPALADALDHFGHGTMVAGIVGGKSADGKYMGIAPDAKLISVKVLGDDGSASMADVLNGLEWVNQNYKTYGIRVVNLSLAAGLVDSYVNNPINAAVEALWLNGVVVVAASSNRGSDVNAVSSAPGNDPFIITVGAVNDQGTPVAADDTLATFSSRGTTLDGFAKPEVTAPGQSVISPVDPAATLPTKYPNNVVDLNHLRASGTSLAAPSVSGAVALLLQARPDLTPNQIKWLLANSSQKYAGQTDSAGVIRVDEALRLADSLPLVPSANQGLTLANGVQTTATGAAIDQVYWDEVYWDEVYWDEVYWDEVYWAQ